MREPTELDSRTKLIHAGLSESEYFYDQEETGKGFHRFAKFADKIWKFTPIFFSIGVCLVIYQYWAEENQLEISA